MSLLPIPRSWRITGGVQLSDPSSSSPAPAGNSGVPPALDPGAVLSINTQGTAWGFLIEEVCDTPVFFPILLKAGINCQILLKPYNL